MERSEIVGRTAAHLDTLVEVATEVHELDGYPAWLPDGDIAGFLFPADALVAFTLLVDGRPAGHVALHRRSATAVMDRAVAATGRPEGDLAVVARLLVSPAARRRGHGGTLLERATSAAHEAGRWPVLDTVAGSPATALYEACGWREEGAVTYRFRDGTAMEGTVFIGPPPRAGS